MPLNKRDTAKYMLEPISTLALWGHGDAKYAENAKTFILKVLFASSAPWHALRCFQGVKGRTAFDYETDSSVSCASCGESAVITVSL